MTAKITSLNDLKIQIKNTVDLKDYMEKDGIRFSRKSGQNWTALCPFHNEKTPSFTVNESYQNYHCFGCGKHGDIFTYIQETEAVSWKDSVTYLAKEYNIAYEFNNEDSKKYEKFSRAYEIIETLAKYYKRSFDRLTDNHPAKKMILDRKLDYNSAEYGYAPESSADILNFIIKKGYTKDELKDLGLLYDSDYMQQSNRLVFVINNYMGKPIGFTGRALTEKDAERRKYVNSSDSIIFHKKNVVYNIDKAKKEASKRKEIYLVEGQFDVAAMTANGYPNTVAISGTAFTNEQLREIIRSIGVDGNIILLLDDDSAGQKAAQKIFSEHPSIHSNLYQITLKPGEDPCDYLQHTKELPEKELFIEKSYQRIKSNYSFSSIQDKTEFLLSVQKDLTQYITNQTIKEQYLRRTCTFIGFSYDKIKILSDEKANKDEIIKAQVKQEASNNSYINYYLNALNILFTYPDIFRKNLKRIQIEKLSTPMKKVVADFYKGRVKVLAPENYEENSSEYKIIKAIQNVNYMELENREVLSQYEALLNHAYKLQQKEKRNKIKRSVIENMESATNPQAIIQVLKELEQKTS